MDCNTEVNEDFCLQTPLERMELWNFLEKRCVNVTQNFDERDNDSLDDPFDVSDMILPPIKELVENAIRPLLEEWRELDSRKISLLDKLKEEGRMKSLASKKQRMEEIADEGSTESDASEEDVHKFHVYRRSQKVKLRLGWIIPTFTLPDNFDYKSERGPPTSEQMENDEFPREKVVSLSGQVGEEADYESELWNIFNAIPSEEQLLTQHGINQEKILRSNMKKLQTDLEDASKIDGATAALLRPKAMHHYPLGCTNSHEGSNMTGDITLTFEFLKRKLKPQLQMDGRKMEIEFHGEQTLLDVHNAIRKHSCDPLDLISALHQANGANVKGMDSGLFFIENTFYITGDEDYSKPIIDWLNCKEYEDTTDSIIFPREAFLGITMDTLQTKKMEHATLQNIPIRLGTRYIHIYAGNLQTSVIVSNIRAKRSNDWEYISKEHYPVVLDPWSFSQNYTCQGCHKLPAVVICLDDEFTDGSATPLCVICHHALHYDSHGALRLFNFKVYPIELLHERLLTVEEDQVDFYF